jgi:hypothetical protein
VLLAEQQPVAADNADPWKNQICHGLHTSERNPPSMSENFLKIHLANLHKDSLKDFKKKKNFVKKREKL